MWINEISIDKGYGSEYRYLIKILKKVRYLSFSEEESKSRYIINIACATEEQENVKTFLLAVIKDIIFVFIKRKKIVAELDFIEDSYKKVALISSIVHFDNAYEERYFDLQMKNITDFNIDGILNFRLKALQRNWIELAQMTAGVLAYADGDDLNTIAAFMTSTSYAKYKTVIIKKLDGKIVANYGADNKKLNIVPLFNDESYNLLDAIIRVNPKEVILKTESLNSDFVSALSKLVKIKVEDCLKS